MAQVPEQADGKQQDAIYLLLGQIAARRAALLSLRVSKPEKYDEALKQGFPLDVFELLEAITVECGNRTAALAGLYQELAEHLLAGDADEDEDGDDSGDDDDEASGVDGEVIVGAARVLGRYLRDLSVDGTLLPDDVKEAVAALEENGLLADVPDEPEEPEASSGDDGGAEKQPDEHQPQEASNGAASGEASGVEAAPGLERP